MILSSLEQCSVEDLRRREVDVLICASGFESRARHLVRTTGLSGRNAIALGFEEFREVKQRVKNDTAFRRWGFREEPSDGGNEDRPAEILRQAVSGLEAPTIVVDISSMTRAWYGAFLRELRSSSFSSLTAYFCYSPAKFRRSPGTYPQNRFVGPVRGFAGLAPPHKPPALILGLGDHIGRGLGIYLEVDPQIAATFVASPTLDPRYEAAVAKVNSELLAHIKPGMQFSYPLLDFGSTFYRLEGVASSLGANSAVVLACTGPKILSLACLLVALSIPNASVWRVSAGDREGATDLKAAGPIVVVKTVWTSET